MKSASVATKHLCNYLLIVIINGFDYYSPEALKL